MDNLRFRVCEMARLQDCNNCAPSVETNYGPAVYGCRRIANDIIRAVLNHAAERIENQMLLLGEKHAANLLREMAKEYE